MIEDRGFIYEEINSIFPRSRIWNEWIKGYDSLDFYQWAIVLKELGEPIGSISVVDKNDNLDIIHIGYCIGSKWWNQGITTEAFKAIILFFFEEVGANRIESQHDPNNPGSGKVMEKCGLNYTHFFTVALYFKKIYDIIFLWHMPIKTR